MRIAPDIDVDDVALAEVCDSYGIAELQIFGSRARGTAGPGSDVDVLYALLPGRRSAGRSSSSPTSWLPCSAIRLTWCHGGRCTLSSGLPCSLRPGPCMRDILLPGEMIQAAERAYQLTDGVSLPDLQDDRLRSESLLWNFTVLGEAATQLSDELKDRFPAIAWQQPARLRNRIVHGYWSIDLEIVHTTAATRLPSFAASLRTVPGHPHSRSQPGPDATPPPQPTGHQPRTSRPATHPQQNTEAGSSATDRLIHG